MAHMKLLLAAALVGTVTAACKSSTTCCTGLEALNCNKMPKGDLFNNLVALKAAQSGWSKPVDPAQCSCTGLFEAAPASYVAAYTVECSGRQENSATGEAAGFPGQYDMFTKADTNVTAAKCAERCSATPGCGGFNMQYKTDEVGCKAIGVNVLCDGSKVKVGEEKDLKTSRSSKAVFMRADTSSMALPTAWAGIPDNLKAQAYKFLIEKMALGGTVTAADICVQSTSDKKAKQACSANQLNAAATSAPATAALALIAAAAFALRN